jgi:hypothetical protein
LLIFPILVCPYCREVMLIAVWRWYGEEHEAQG